MNNLFKINLNSNQLIKFGLHIGRDTVDYTNYPFISGTRNNIKYIDISESVLQLRKLAYVYKKILFKREITLLDYDNKSRVLKKLSSSINSNSLYNFKVIKNFKSGLVSNKEIRKKFLFLKKYSNNYLLRNNNFFRPDNKNYVSNKKDKPYSNDKFPSLLVLLGLNKNLLLEFKNKNILTSCTIDTSDFHYVSNYNIVLNNRSISSISYFSKIFNK